MAAYRPNAFLVTTAKWQTSLLVREGAALRQTGNSVMRSKNLLFGSRWDERKNVWPTNRLRNVTLALILNLGACCYKSGSIWDDGQQNVMGYLDGRRNLPKATLFAYTNQCSNRSGAMKYKQTPWP
jgi:hypothetical protein